MQIVARGMTNPPPQIERDHAIGATSTEIVIVCVPPPRMMPLTGHDVLVVAAPGDGDVLLAGNDVVGRIEIDQPTLGQNTDTHACDASAPISRSCPAGGRVNK